MDIPRECNLLDREIEEYPEDLKEQVVRLSDWIRELIQLYPNQIQVKVIDALSPLGLYKKLRYRIKEFPIDWTCDRDSRLSPTRSSWSVLSELLTIRKIMARK